MAYDVDKPCSFGGSLMADWPGSASTNKSTNKVS